MHFLLYKEKQFCQILHRSMAVAQRRVVVSVVDVSSLTLGRVCHGLFFERF